MDRSFQPETQEAVNWYTVSECRKFVSHISCNQTSLMVYITAVENSPDPQPFELVPCIIFKFSDDVTIIQWCQLNGSVIPTRDPGGSKLTHSIWALQVVHESRPREPWKCNARTSSGGWGAIACWVCSDKRHCPRPRNCLELRGERWTLAMQIR